MTDGSLQRSAERSSDEALPRRAGYVDAFAHFLPPQLRDALQGQADMTRDDLINWNGSKALCDIHERIAVLDEEDIDVQVLTTPSPSLESVFDPAQATALARVANESLSETVNYYPSRFIGVATVSLLSVADAIVELERSIVELGLRGVLLYTNINGTLLDHPDLTEFFAAAAELGAPIWLHPASLPGEPGRSLGDLPAYDLQLIFGWPHETTIAMNRLIIGGVINRNPGLRILAHHAGGMMPFFLERGALHYSDKATLERLSLSEMGYADQVRSFYVDTVTSGSSLAIETTREVFGAEQMMFASDMPFGPQEGRTFLRKNREGLELSSIPEDEKRLIRSENALQFVSGPQDSGIQEER